MASFTDINPQLTSYTPYRQQLPVEAMVEVGRIKQQQYDQGVQKIQSQIDNIAGMDVIKPIHKEYLQSKLNELGSNLKKVAAGDFSNFQLVNSVGGMANQIVKDPIIQNAVISTQRVKNQQANLESAKRSGKSSVQNEAFFNKQVGEWINDKNPETSFNGEYVEYTDIDKKLREVADKVHEIDKSIEVPFIRDDQGNVLYFDNSGNSSLNPTKGEKQIDGAMLSIKTKGKPAEKILANFYDSLNENDQRQLGIDSWYHYRNAGPELFKRDIINGYNDTKKTLSDKMVNLSVSLKNPNLSSKEKSVIQAQLSVVNTTLKDGSLDRAMQGQLDQLSSGKRIDDFKYKLYTQKYLTNLAKDLAYQSYEQAYKENPYFQADMKRKDLQFKYLEENNRNIRFAQEQQLKYQELGLKQQEFAKKYKGGQDYVTSGALATGESAPTINTLQKDFNSSIDNFNALGAEYANILFPKESNPSMTGEDKLKAMGKLVSEYRENPKKNLTSDQIEYLEHYRVLENDLTSHLNLINSTKKKSEEFLQEHGKNEINSKIKGINLGGVSYSPEDIYNANKEIQKFYEIKYFGGAGGGTQGPVLNREALVDHISKYEGGKYFPLIQSYLNGNKEVGNSLINAEQVSGNIREGQSKFESDYISKFSPKYQVQRAPINLENDVDKERINALLTTKQSQFAELGALDTEKKGNYDPATVADIINGKYAKGTQAVIEKKQDGSGQVVLFGQKGDKQLIPVSSDELRKFFPDAGKSSPVSGIVDMIRHSPGFTTNSANIRVDGANNPSAAVNAYFSGYMLGGLKDSPYASTTRIDIQGSPRNTGNSDTDKYDVILYVKDPSSNSWKAGIINEGGYTSEAGVANILTNINPQAVEEAIKTFK